MSVLGRRYGVERRYVRDLMGNLMHCQRKLVRGLWANYLLVRERGGRFAAGSAESMFRNSDLLNFITGRGTLSINSYCLVLKGELLSGLGCADG